jgi:antitoxin ParD1/3/4
MNESEYVGPVNIRLPPDLERLVREKVATGRYASATEVVGEGLRLLAEQELMRERQLGKVRADVQEGLEQARRGHLIDGSVFAAELRKVIDRFRASPSGGGELPDHAEGERRAPPVRRVRRKGKRT